MLKKLPVLTQLILFCVSDSQSQVSISIILASQKKKKKIYYSIVINQFRFLDFFSLMQLELAWYVFKLEFFFFTVKPNVVQFRCEIESKDGLNTLSEVQVRSTCPFKQLNSLGIVNWYALGTSPQAWFRPNSEVSWTDQAVKFLFNSSISKAQPRLIDRSSSEVKVIKA